MFTHRHRSHLGGLAALKRLTGATNYAHNWEADIIGGQRKAQPVTWRRARAVRTWWQTYPFERAKSGLRQKTRRAPSTEPSAEGDAIGPLKVITRRELARARASTGWNGARFCGENRNLADSGSGLARIQLNSDHIAPHSTAWPGST